LSPIPCKMHNLVACSFARRGSEARLNMLLGEKKKKKKKKKRACKIIKLMSLVAPNRDVKIAVGAVVLVY